LGVEEGPVIWGGGGCCASKRTAKKVFSSNLFLLRL
jgi:hypothetical protein